MCLNEFYPQEFGAYSESSYAKGSKYEESGAQGCGIKPICSETKWVTERQKSFPFFHRKQVPNMSCVLKKDAYKACLAAAGQPIPPDLSGPPVADTGATDNTADTTSAVKRTVSPAKPINWTMIILIAVLAIVITTSIVLIIRAKRAGRI